MSATSFRQIEHAAWIRKAAIYDEVAGVLTGQAIAPILDALGHLSGARLLDVACGTGHLAGAAADRGADVDGVDLTAPMVGRARTNYPDLAFIAADGEALPYGDASFDALTCAFGLLHMEHPDIAIDEAFRVLRPGGRFVFTLWYGAARGGEFFALVEDAVQGHGARDVSLPPAPDAFRLTDPEECSRALGAAGFADAQRTTTIPVSWRGGDPDDLIDFIDKVTVRTAMVLHAQTAAVRQRIHRAIVEGAKRHRKGDGIELAWPAALVTAVKP